jgi:two-component system, cell cycle sensor histidine kinase and response regulator CckA
VPTEEELLGRIAALEHELRRQRESAEATFTILEQVMRQMPALYWVVDRELNIVGAGGETLGITGYGNESIAFKTIYDVAAADPMDTDTVANHKRAITGETVVVETNYRGKFLATVIGPYRRGNEIVGAIGTSIDVTPWRLLERRMVDAQRAESLGVLAGGLAHDFNNLLVAVLGNADLGLREIGEAKTPRTALENIRTAGLRAAELTEQLLAYAGRGGAGTTRVEPGLLVEELLRIIAPSVPNDIKVTTDVPLKLAVRGDPAQLRQVLLNLINNARDALAGRGGEIMIRASAQHVTGEPHPHDILSPSAGSYIVVEVEDNGPGMDSETRRHVFEPFFTTKQRGHGLGLAAVLGIVRAHGGGVRVISSPGAGAKFQILWPAAVTAPMRATPQPPIGSRTVLVIDDEDLVRDVVARMVEDLGYAAVTASNGKAGLELIDQQDVDAVLVDMTMPMMSGADVVASLRERKPNLPIVVCSGYDRNGRGPVQADAYLPKPFRIDALERTLAKLLPLRSV